MTAQADFGSRLYRYSSYLRDLVVRCPPRGDGSCAGLEKIRPRGLAIRGEPYVRARRVATTVQATAMTASPTALARSDRPIGGMPPSRLRTWTRGVRSAHPPPVAPRTQSTSSSAVRPPPQRPKPAPAANHAAYATPPRPPA